MNQSRELAHPAEYQRAHRRVYQLWGRARQYPCASCGRDARQWAYEGTDPGELCGQDYIGRKQGRRPMYFSIWPEFYMPMCVSCHERRDGKRLVAELSQEWLDNHCQAV